MDPTHVAESGAAATSSSNPVSPTAVSLSGSSASPAERCTFAHRYRTAQRSRPRPPETLETREATRRLNEKHCSAALAKGMRAPPTLIETRDLRRTESKDNFFQPRRVAKMARDFTAIKSTVRSILDPCSAEHVHLVGRRSRGRIRDRRPTCDIETAQPPSPAQRGQCNGYGRACTVGIDVSCATHGFRCWTVYRVHPLTKRGVLTATKSGETAAA